jgi:hypothetical protein
MSEINDFCVKECPLGIKKSGEFLDKNKSAFDAAVDMHYYVKECIKTCPYKDKFAE